MKLRRDLGITRKSACHMVQRMRECFASDGSGRFAGTAEVDETYIGGKEKNRHASKKLNAGRGPVGKTVVAGAKDRDSVRVEARPAADTTQDTLRGFVRGMTVEGATVCKDDHAGYQGIERPHTAVKHSVAEYVNCMARSNGIESFRAGLKRGYHGTSRHFSDKRLHRHVNEFAGRHNLRNMDIIAIMESMVKAMPGKRPAYLQLVT